MEASFSKAPAVVRALLAASANPRLENRGYENALSVARDVPDSSADLRDLQRLMQVSVAGDFASDSADGGEGDATKAVDINNMESLSLSWDEDDDEEEAPSWMLDSSSYKPD